MRIITIAAIAILLLLSITSMTAFAGKPLANNTSHANNAAPPVNNAPANDAPANNVSNQGYNLDIGNVANSSSAASSTPVDPIWLIIIIVAALAVVFFILSLLYKRSKKSSENRSQDNRFDESMSFGSTHPASTDDLMVKRLEEYIIKKESQGYDRQQLKEFLKNQGYKAADIDQALRNLRNSQ